MNISRGFLIMGSLYLLVGILLGMYMGGSGDHTLAPVHAHINLVGFTLMTVFGIAYRVMPDIAGSIWAKGHFWLHQIGGLILLIGLFLLISGRMPEAMAAKIMPVAEMAVFLGMLCWFVNVLRSR